MPNSALPAHVLPPSFRVLVPEGNKVSTWCFLCRSDSLPAARGLAHSESEQPRPKLLATWVDSAPRSATTARGPNPACQLRMGFTFFLISWGKEGLIFCDT